MRWIKLIDSCKKNNIKKSSIYLKQYRTVDDILKTYLLVNNHDLKTENQFYSFTASSRSVSQSIWKPVKNLRCCATGSLMLFIPLDKSKTSFVISLCSDIALKRHKTAIYETVFNRNYIKLSRTLIKLAHTCLKYLSVLRSIFMISKQKHLLWFFIQNKWLLINTK